MSDTAKMADEIRAILKDLLSEKEEAARLVKAEQVVHSAESTILELTNAVASKEDELTILAETNEGLTGQIEQLNSKVAELEGKVEESSNLFKELEEGANKAKAELASMAKDRKLEVRIRELEADKVLRSGDKQEAQKARIRDMGDEEFASYKSDLIDMRSELAGALENEAKRLAEGTAVGDEPAVEVAPPDLSQAGKEAAAAALDVEVASADITNEWAAWGEQMANNMRSDK